MSTAIERARDNVMISAWLWDAAQDQAQAERQFCEIQLSTSVRDYMAAHDRAAKHFAMPSIKRAAIIGPPAGHRTALERARIAVLSAVLMWDKAQEESQAERHFSEMMLSRELATYRRQIGRTSGRKAKARKRRADK